jgi:TonB-dependent receptor
MFNRMFIISLFLVLALASLVSGARASSSAVTVQGRVKDAQTGEALPSANVMLVGTGLGAAADINGKYLIRNVPAGSYIIRASYIGYKSIEVPIDIKEGVNVTQDLALENVGIRGEGITVTAQAQGQNEAINRQLAADHLMNVVSSARIQELPDANAAESIGRLPGVSITRYGGEGTKVVIRGLEPKYNVVTVDGVRMASSNAGDRSTDLSMISPNMLESIEVSKTVMADQDADVLGGTVNFKLREAQGGKEGLGLELLAQGGYTGLSNAYNKYRNHKFVASLEGRFLNERLGLFLQLNSERRNLSSNEFSATYDPDQQNSATTNYTTREIALSNYPRDRQRLNGTLALDYRLPEGKVSLTNFIGSGITEEQNRREGISVGGSLVTGFNRRTYSMIFARSEVAMMTNTLRLDQQLPLVHMDASLSHTYSETKNPNDWSVNFLSTDAGINQLRFENNMDPRIVVTQSNTDPVRAKLNTLTHNNRFGKERALMASLDLDFPLDLIPAVTSVVKFGGKYRYQKRLYTNEQFGTNYTFTSPSATGAALMIIDHFKYAVSDPTNLPMSLFVDPDYSYGTFLNGDFTMSNPLNFNVSEELIRFCRAHTDEIALRGGQEGWARNNFQSITNNYSGEETLAAFYAMWTVKVGTDLTIIPGVRYQNLRTSYAGTRGNQTSQSYTLYDHSGDTTVTLDHPFWLPNLNIRYKPFSWFDVRLSYSNSISYPDFNTIIPRIDVSGQNIIAWNNYTLEPSRSKNYDVYLSFSENAIGLFTVGGFLKNIDNLIYPWTFVKRGLEAAPYYLTTKSPDPNASYTINTFKNNPYVVVTWGLEFDWQTHFWYLPEPLNGLILNVNYTHVTSKAEYPYTLFRTVGRVQQVIDTSYTDRLISQPDHIINLSLGYDYRDFSVRVSMLYQADIFTTPSQWSQLAASTAAYKRWDISFKQTLPWFGLQVYANVNNLNGAQDLSVLQMYPAIPTVRQAYGLTADIGLRWQR